MALSNNLAIVAAIDPQIVDNNTVSTDLVDMSLYSRVIFIVEVGFCDTTVNAKIREAKDDAGVTEQDLTGLAITQLADDDDNKQVILEVSAANLSAGYRYVSCDVTVGNGTSGAYISAVGLAGDSRYNPASDNDLASVAEIKTK